MQLPDTGQHAETRNTPIAAIINAEANGPTPKSVVSRRDIVTRALPAVVLVSVAAITPAWLNSRTSSSPVTAQPTAGGSVSVVGKPTGGEPTVPFLRGNELARGGKRTALPSTLAPTSLKAAKQNLVVESRKGEESTAAIIDASGNVRILRIVKPPLAVHPDGARIAGMSTARGATGSAVVVVDSTSEKILAHVDLPVGSSPELFLGAGSAWVVLDHPAGASEVWNTETGARLTLGSLGSVSGARSTTHPTEDLVVSADEQGRLIAWRPQGSSVSMVWTGAVVADCPPAFSPSGTSLAVRSGNRIVFLDPGTGQEKDAASSQGVATHLVWEDDSSLVGFDPTSLTPSVERCSASAPSCVALDLPAGTLIAR